MHQEDFIPHPVIFQGKCRQYRFGVLFALLALFLMINLFCDCSVCNGREQVTSLWNLSDHNFSSGWTTVWSIVIIGGEIFTIELRPGSEHRGGIDSGQAECELNWQLFIVCYAQENKLQPCLIAWMQWESGA